MLGHARILCLVLVGAWPWTAGGCDTSPAHKESMVHRMREHLEETQNLCHADLKQCKLALIVPSLGSHSMYHHFEVLAGSTFAMSQGEGDIGIVVAYDHGDHWFSDASHRAWMDHKVHELQEHYKKPKITLHFAVNHGAHTYVSAVNAATMDAYHKGFDYFFQINDDIKILSPGYDVHFKHGMQRMDSFGLTGPHREGGGTGLIYTEACVGRMHVCALDGFFPGVFKNWFTDDWVTGLYRKFGRSSEEPVSIANPHPHRYAIDYKAKWIVHGQIDAAYCRIVDHFDHCLKHAFKAYGPTTTRTTSTSTRTTTTRTTTTHTTTTKTTTSTTRTSTTRTTTTHTSTTRTRTTSTSTTRTTTSSTKTTTTKTTTSSTMTTSTSTTRTTTSTSKTTTTKTRTTSTSTTRTTTTTTSTTTTKTTTTKTRTTSTSTTRTTTTTTTTTRTSTTTTTTTTTRTSTTTSRTRTTSTSTTRTITVTTTTTNESMRAPNPAAVVWEKVKRPLETVWDRASGPAAKVWAEGEANSTARSAAVVVRGLQRREPAACGAVACLLFATLGAAAACVSRCRARLPEVPAPSGDEIASLTKPGDTEAAAEVDIEYAAGAEQLRQPLSPAAQQEPGESVRSVRQSPEAAAGLRLGPAEPAEAEAAGLGREM